MSKSVLALLIWGAMILAVQAEPATDLAQSTQAADLLAQANEASLDEPIDLLDEVTVTATLGRGSRVRENTSSIYVVTQEEIQRKGSRSIGDALQGVPGVVSNLWGAGEDVHSTYFIRGLPTTSTGLLIDGRTVNNLNQEHVDLAELPVFGIERVEVLKGGAGSTLYGSTAVGGVINVITRRPPTEFEVNTNIAFGSYGYSNYSLSLGGPITENLRYSVFATTFNSNNDYFYQIQRDNRTLFNEFYPATTLSAIRPNGEVNSSSFGLNLDWDLDTRTNLALSSYLRKGSRGVSLFSLTDPRNLIETSGGAGCEQDPFCTPDELGLNESTRPLIRIDYSGLALTLDRQLGAGEDSRLQVRLGIDTGYTTESDREVDFVIAEDNSTEVTVLNARILHDWQISAGFNLTYGLDFIRESGRSFSLDLLTPGATLEPAFDARVNRPSVFAVGTIKLAENLTTSLGFRQSFTNTYEFSSSSDLVTGTSRTYESSFDPSIGVVWQVIPTLALRSGFARVYKTPNFNDLFANGEIQGNPNLRPEAGSTFDVGFDWEPSPEITVRAAYFNNDIQNLIAYNRITPLQNGIFAPQDEGLLAQGYESGALVRANYPTVNFSGLEFSFNWRFAPGWAFFATETYTDARILQDFKGELNQSQYPLVPYHSGQGGFTYTSPGDWRFALFGNFQGLRATDPYHIGPSVGFTPNGDLALTPSGNPVPNLGYLPPTTLLPGYFTLDLSFRIPLNSVLTLSALVNNLTNLAYERNYGNGAPPTNFTVGLEAKF
ncbi:TonB-dependent receptor [Candidatus Cyanaurora vandensis]|uniref:TonB-dependent receptor n=1 Tax=Candidatus Cyanaurora vandensis TaxID=2714958 RepID=UPI002580FC89|nr:TonB-dependent receptor [Candidatus Cyanaurora vandensis]